jgi:hypothetical protein
MSRFAYRADKACRSIAPALERIESIRTQTTVVACHTYVSRYCTTLIVPAAVVIYSFRHLNPKGVSPLTDFDVVSLTDSQE